MVLQNTGHMAPHGNCGAFLAASLACVNFTGWMSASSHAWVLEPAGGPNLFRIALQKEKASMLAMECEGQQHSAPAGPFLPAKQHL